MGISQWVRYRKPLAQVFHLKVPRAPCANTYRNILGQVIDIEDLEHVVREFFADQRKAGTQLGHRVRWQDLAGHDCRWTDARATSTRGVLPAEGWVLFQVEVECKENEIRRPAGAKNAGFTGKIVTGDAMFAQRELSVQIVEAGGNYSRWRKDNQSTAARHRIALSTGKDGKGFSQGTQDFRTAETVEKDTDGLNAVP